MGFVERSLLKKIVKRLNGKGVGAHFDIIQNEYRSSGDMLRAHMPSGVVVDFAELRGLWCAVPAADVDGNIEPVENRQPYSLGIADYSLVPVVADRFIAELMMLNTLLIDQHRKRIAEELAAQKVPLHEPFADTPTALVKNEEPEEYDEEPLSPAMADFIEEWSWEVALPWTLPTRAEEEIVLRIGTPSIDGRIYEVDGIFSMELRQTGALNGQWFEYPAEAESYGLPELWLDDFLIFAEKLRDAYSPDLIGFLLFVVRWAKELGIKPPDWVEETLRVEREPTDADLRATAAEE